MYSKRRASFLFSINQTDQTDQTDHINYNNKQQQQQQTTMSSVQVVNPNADFIGTGQAVAGNIAAAKGERWWCWLVLVGG